MISPPGYPQQQGPSRMDELLRAFLTAKRGGQRATDYGHNPLGGQVGGQFKSNIHAGADLPGISSGGTGGGGHTGFSAYLPLLFGQGNP